MFCRNCGFQIPDDSQFCPKCGTPVVSAAESQNNEQNPYARPNGQQQNVQSQQPQQQAVQAPQAVLPQTQSFSPEPAAAAAAAGPAAAVKVKKSGTVKKLVLIMAALVLVAAIVFVLIKFVFKKPGDAIVAAFSKTLTSESFKADAVIEYDYDEIRAFIKEIGESNDLTGYESEDDFKQAIEDEYGITVNKLESKASAAVSGKNEDFVLYAQFADMYQIRWDEDYLEYKAGNDFTEQHGLETESDKEKTKGDLKEIFEIISSDEIPGSIKDNKDLNSDLKDYFAKNYDQLGVAVAELLNDTDAKYIKDYDKSGSTYTYKIDAFKFADALAKSKTLKCTDDFKEELDELEEEIMDEGIDEAILTVSVTISRGRLETIVLEPEINGYELGKVTINFTDYNKVDSDDLEIQDLSGDDFDPILTPSVLRYAEKSKLRTANSNAKLIFTTISSALWDRYADYGETYSYKRFGKMLSDYDRSDYVQREVYEVMMDCGMTEDEASKYFVYFLLENGTDVKLVQVKGPDGIIGQYPNPADTIDEAKALPFTPETFDYYY